LMRPNIRASFGLRRHAIRGQSRAAAADEVGK
jgi:hypothetical protein